MRIILLFIISLFSLSTIYAGEKYNPEHLKRFQETNECRQCNLRDASLSAINGEGAKLAQAVLNKATLGAFYRSDFTEAFIIGATASPFADLSYSDFTDANLRDSLFSYTKFDGSIFINADLSNIKFAYSGLVDADFTNADTTNIDFNNADLTRSNITKEQLAQAKSVCNAILPDGSRGSCTWREISGYYDPEDLKHFKETNECINCDLSKINYLRARDGAGAILKGTVLNRSILCDFRSSDFTDAALMEVRARRKDFSRSNFTNAKFLNANFLESTLTNTDFTGANLTNANFSKADFTGSNVTMKQLSQAKDICNAILPDGTLGSCD